MRKELNEDINLSFPIAINYEQINRNEKMAKVIFNVTKKSNCFTSFHMCRVDLKMGLKPLCGQLFVTAVNRVLLGYLPADF